MIGEALGVWTWWVLGLVLLGIELAAPGSFMLWFGVSALAVGALSLAVSWTWHGQVITFALLSFASMVVARRYVERRDSVSTLNQGAGRFVGRTYRLREPIVGGFGRLQLDDTDWRVAGPDLPAGAEVRVTGCDGAVLLVEPFTASSRAGSEAPPA